MNTIVTTKIEEVENNNPRLGGSIEQRQWRFSENRHH